MRRYHFTEGGGDGAALNTATPVKRRGWGNVKYVDTHEEDTVVGRMHRCPLRGCGSGLPSNMSMMVDEEVEGLHLKMKRWRGGRCEGTPAPTALMVVEAAEMAAATTASAKAEKNAAMGLQRQRKMWR